MRRILSLTVALILTLLLTACDSSEERAEEHYENAVALLAEGDADRAIIELRNVFQLVGNHLEARHLIADILLNEKQDPLGAYRQYLRLAEQYPDDLKARIELSELAFFSAIWDEFDRHGAKARELAPENTRVQIIAAALDYRKAILDEDNAARSQAVVDARALQDPDAPSRMLRELILDEVIRNQEFTTALSMLDDLTTDHPEEERLWNQRLQILIALGDQAAIEDQLLDLIERFPGNSEQVQTLVRYYLSRGDLDKTETFLRQLVADAPEDENGPRIDLVRFMMELRSPEVARAEINDAIATASDPSPFIMIGAALDALDGDTEKAIQTLEDAIAAAEPSEQVNSMKVALSRILLSTNNQVGARSLVEAVLQDNPNNTAALKMNAEWLIEADDTEGAINALRTALDSDPDDTEAMTLMATAYFRIGSVDLGRDFLALAADGSGYAPAQTLRYAQLLISEERYLPAEDVLLSALRIAPTNLDLLRTAGQLYLSTQDSGRMRQVIDTLRRIDTPDADRIAIELEAQLLNQSGGTDEAIRYLEGLAQGQDADVSTKIMLLRARVSTGDMEGAIALAESFVAEQPDAPARQLVLASTLTAANQLDRALEIYRSVEADFPEDAALKVRIAQLQIQSGDPEGARETIAIGLESSPDNIQLMWANASFLEVDGDIDQAIDLYEQMYALDSNDIVIANNFASLIGTYRDDPESLAQAWTIARRFRDTDMPAVQDTYGWLTHRRGDSADALPYLVSAAENLRDDPIVQYHLGEVLYALDRFEDALAQYRNTLAATGVGDTRPLIASTRDRIAELEATLASQEDASDQ